MKGIMVKDCNNCPYSEKVFGEIGGKVRVHCNYNFKLKDLPKSRYIGTLLSILKKEAPIPTWCQLKTIIKKEVKKVKKSINKIPYFEMKVVKVKKGKCHHYQFGRTEYVNSEYYCRCPKCGESILIKDKPKGNWVNGENLDAMEYPCFCTFENNGKEYYGEINTVVDYYGSTGFTLTDITEQTKGVSTKYTYKFIEGMIKRFKIKIRPGKIIIFEEEE